MQVCLGGRHILAAEILGGRLVTISITPHALLFFDRAPRRLLRSRPTPLSPEQVRRLRGARPTGPPPRPTVAPVTVPRRASTTGVLRVVGQKIALGRVPARQTVTAHVADTTITIDTTAGPRTITRTNNQPDPGCGPRPCR